MSHNTVLIMAGGTGGHVYPALAVAKYLQQRDIDILWLGTERGIESTVVPNNGFTLLTLSVAGVRGKNLLHKCFAPIQIAYSVFQALFIVLKHKPALALGMGGFASGPGGIAAFITGTPLCIHEQNSIAGLTNKILYPFAKRVFQAFPGAFTKQASKLNTTGNPVRADISAIAQPVERLSERQGPVRILVIGGSLGAQKLNQVIPQTLSQLHGKLTYEVQHQTGKEKLEQTQKNYAACDVSAEIMAYIEDMTAAYSWADVVICRAGAMTIAELAIVGIASVLVPYPYAVDDHQTFNAKYLSDSGCAVLIPEKDLTAETLANELLNLCSSRQQLLRMAEAVHALGKPQATQEVAENCLELIHV